MLEPLPKRSVPRVQRWGLHYLCSNRRSIAFLRYRYVILTAVYTTGPAVGSSGLIWTRMRSDGVKWDAFGYVRCLCEILRL